MPYGHDSVGTWAAVYAAQGARPTARRRHHLRGRDEQVPLSVGLGARCTPGTSCEVDVAEDRSVASRGHGPTFHLDRLHRRRRRRRLVVMVSFLSFHP